MTYVPLKIRSTYSLSNSTIKLDKLVKKATEFGFKSLAITELGNIYSPVKFVKACQNANIKPILGCDFYLNDGSTITILVKNIDGWKGLLKAISFANLPENYIIGKERAAISLEKLAEFANGNFIVFSGSIYSHCGRLFTDFQRAIKAQTYEQAKELVRSDWKEITVRNMRTYKDLFGKENFFPEIQAIENNSIPACDIVSKIIRSVGKQEGFRCIATPKVHYLDKHDAEDHRILICSDKGATLSNIEQKIELSGDYELLSFFRGSNSFLPSESEMLTWHSQEELDNTNLVVSEIKNYDILSNPKMPVFECPNGYDASSYMNSLCIEGFKKKKLNLESLPVYKQRFDYEFKIFNEAGLAPYFLIVHDIMSWCRAQGWYCASRGSVGGSIIAYAMDICESDPIEYNLLVERFYNHYRNKPGKINLPDIDMDFPTLKRSQIFNYIKYKYKPERTAQISTFGGLQGKGAIKEVLRAKERCSHIEMNKITEFIPDPAKISDQLEEMREAYEKQEEGASEPSILQWAVENVKKMEDFCQIDEQGNLTGEYAFDFAQAIRLEGCKKTRGTHAAGIIIAGEPLENFCPVIYDHRSGDHRVGWDYPDAEAAGGVKLDALGVAGHDDIMDCIHSINFGDEDEFE